MNRVDYLAEVSIGRGCGFAMLAIITTMCGMAGNLELCLKVGAGLCALLGVVLGWRAWRAIGRDPRRTEVYLMLDKGRDLPEDYPLAQINEALRRVYVRYAEYSGALALILAAMAFVLPPLVGV
jgi:hypothetical protein